MSIRSLSSSLTTAAVLLTSTIASAHGIVADGDPSDWSTRLPNAANLGMVARAAGGRGEFIWRDATGDTRTDIATPEVVADIAAFQVTGSATGLAFLLRRQPGATFSGQPIQVQIAIDTDRMPGSGQVYFAGFADTKVAEGARWERLVQTLFGSGGAAQVIDANFNKVADATAAQGAGGDVEILVPWTALGLNGPPATPLRFTVATFRAQNNDLTVDVGGPNISNALDCVSDYGDPAASNYPNTWNDVMDGVVDYNFDVWFDGAGEVYAPLVVQRFLANAPGSASDEWYTVRNVSPGPLALDNYKLGNQETPDGTQGMYTFPAGATLAPGASFTVARTGVAYQTYFGKAPDAELSPGSVPAIPKMMPYNAWATGQMALADAGDELLVLDPSNVILDVAVYGSGVYAGVNAYTPAPPQGDVLSRNASSVDTDDCKVDFSDAGQSCTNDAQCGGTCRQCAGNVCGNKPQGAACPDANPCNGDEVCDGNGACVTSPAPPCDDGNPCTADACDAVMGCTHTPLGAGASCSDGDVCNGSEVCDANAVCQPGTPLDCKDADPCTVDTCDKVMGCQHAQAADGASCSDGDACNGDEVCMGGACTAGTPLACDDANDCTADSCDAQVGCKHDNVDDGTACGGASCNGLCVSGECKCTGGTSTSTSTGAGGMTTTSSTTSATTSSTTTSAAGGAGPGGGGTGGSGGGIQESACGCRTAGGDEGPAAAWLLGIAAAAVLGRRRSASRREPSR